MPREGSPLSPRALTYRERRALQLFKQAARKFIRKVETGQARSVTTYRELREALAVAEGRKDG